MGASTWEKVGTHPARNVMANGGYPGERCCHGLVQFEDEVYLIGGFLGPQSGVADAHNQRRKVGEGEHFATEGRKTVEILVL